MASNTAIITDRNAGHLLLLLFLVDSLLDIRSTFLFGKKVAEFVKEE